MLSSQNKNSRPNSEYQYDVFISHASEDKRTLVFELANLLRSLGLRVWYDDFVLAVGDSLSRKIDEGLVRSKYGIVVISPAFLSKNWPEYELRALLTKEMNGEKVILPVWHQVTREDVCRFSPSLADKVALMTDGGASTELARALVKVIRPDIHQVFLRAMLIAAEQTKSIKLVDLGSIKQSTPRHPTLPPDLMARIITIHAVTDDVLRMSLSETIYSFRCDLTPECEIRVWEHICALYYIATKGRGYSRAKRRDIFCLFLYASMAPVSPKQYRRFPSLKPREIQSLLLLADTKLSDIEYN